MDFNILSTLLHFTHFDQIVEFGPVMYYRNTFGNTWKYQRMLLQIYANSRIWKLESGNARTVLSELWKAIFDIPKG